MMIYIFAENGKQLKPVQLKRPVHICTSSSCHSLLVYFFTGKTHKATTFYSGLTNLVQYF